MTQELRRLLDVVQREAVNDGYKDRPESDNTFEAKAMLMDAIQALLDRLEKAEKDAHRYEVLRNEKYQRHKDDISVSDRYLDTYFGTDLDEAVDALEARFIAMEASK